MRTKAPTGFGCTCDGCPGMRAALAFIEQLEQRINADTGHAATASARLERKVDDVLAKIDPEAPKP